MRHQIPEILVDAIAQGIWRSANPDVLRRILGDDLPDLELFEDVNVIRRTPARLDAAGYVDDPEFCMVRESNRATDDPGIVFERVLFLGGTIVPGDDVLVVADMGSDEQDPPILVFDWERSVPNRWVIRGKLSALIQGLSSNGG